MAALSFSQMRGTAKNQVGRTSGRYATTWRGSGQQVVEKPTNIGRYCVQFRSAMCAIGSHDTSRPSSGNSMILWMPSMVATMLACVISTPFGGPVVPLV